MTRPPSVLRDWVLPLVARAVIWSAIAIAVVIVLRQFGLWTNPLVPVVLVVIATTLTFLARVPLQRAEPARRPILDPVPELVRGDSGDVAVRRIADAIHGAGPRRRMTGRALGRMLGDIAAERALDPAAPPLSPELQHLIAEAGHPDARAHPVGTIDRAALHRYLRELAAPGPSPSTGQSVPGAPPHPTAARPLSHPAPAKERP